MNPNNRQDESDVPQNQASSGSKAGADDDALQDQIAAGPVAGVANADANPSQPGSGHTRDVDSPKAPIPSRFKQTSIGSWLRAGQGEDEVRVQIKARNTKPKARTNVPNGPSVLDLLKNAEKKSSPTKSPDTSAPSAPAPTGSLVAQATVQSPALVSSTSVPSTSGYPVPSSSMPIQSGPRSGFTIKPASNAPSFPRFDTSSIHPAASSASSAFTTQTGPSFPVPAASSNQISPPLDAPSNLSTPKFTSSFPGPSTSSAQTTQNQSVPSASSINGTPSFPALFTPSTDNSSLFPEPSSSSTTRTAPSLSVPSASSTSAVATSISRPFASPSINDPSPSSAPSQLSTPSTLLSIGAVSKSSDPADSTSSVATEATEATEATAATETIDHSDPNLDEMGSQKPTQSKRIALLRSAVTKSAAMKSAVSKPAASKPTPSKSALSKSAPQDSALNQTSGSPKDSASLPLDLASDRFRLPAPATPSRLSTRPTKASRATKRQNVEEKVFVAGDAPLDLSDEGIAERQRLFMIKEAKYAEEGERAYPYLGRLPPPGYRYMNARMAPLYNDGRFDDHAKQAAAHPRNQKHPYRIPDAGIAKPDRSFMRAYRPNVDADVRDSNQDDARHTNIVDTNMDDANLGDTNGADSEAL